MAFRRGIYVVPTHRWYIERTVSPLDRAGDRDGVGLDRGSAMLWFAATGFCIMANSLYWLGAEPRLVPEQSPPSPPS